MIAPGKTVDVVIKYFVHCRWTKYITQYAETTKRMEINMKKQTPALETSHNNAKEQS